MGRNLVIATIAATLVLGGPVFVPSTGTVHAQVAGCSCFASFDAIDSDLQYVGRYFGWMSMNLSETECATACDGWWREWFYWNACDHPIRINRGRNAVWGYQTGWSEAFIGPDTWWCPLPPP